MNSWRSLVYAFAAIIAGPVASPLAESKFAMPSAAPKIGVDVTGRAEDIGDKIEAVFFNIDMVATYLREEKIKGRLGDYLKEIGAKPTPGEVHLFYIQSLVDANGNVVELRDFQYLTHGKTTVDAIKESFTLEDAPGTQDRIDPLLPGTRLEGIYVSAHSDSDGYIIRGGSLNKDFYQKIRAEGLVLREQRAKDRAETKRLEEKLQKLRGAHAASDASAKAQLERDRARGPLPPGPALFPPGPPAGSPTVYLPPTKTDQASNMEIGPLINPPAAHPRVPFNPPPTPLAPAIPQEPVAVPKQL
ncbi:hypothetical protein [Rhizobium sp. F40D2]|uniref:hypothetical protein n=1 Tax=Rhizobium sp. F40D2 TaxID=3453141 RepID=UPI003F246C07